MAVKLPFTCKTCQKRYYCLEYTRWYPCRDYEKEERKNIPKRKKKKKGG